MPIPILRTKLHRPPIGGPHLHREHLLDRLNQSRHRPLTLVSAPAGYGKSTLVSCWIESRDVPSTWVSLDESDNDLRLFLTYMVSAIEIISPDVCTETRSILKVDPLPPVAIIVRSLINELDRIENPIILALDDYHLIRERRIHELIAGLLHHPSPSMHLVLIARRDPPLQLTTLRARGQMVEIRTGDLRFTLEETSLFLQQMTGATVDDSVAAILEEKTEGWVTGLRLAALSMRLNKEIARKLDELPTENRYVMDYVVTEILAHYPQAVQTWMLKTSVLSRFCAPLCEAVCRSATDADDGGPKGRDFLELLENDNLFVIPLDKEQKWFRFHHLFQALLKRQLKQRFNTEDIVTLHSRASAWFDENGYIEEALWHAHKSGDLSAAARLVRKHRHEIANREQWYQLNDWLKKFPQDFIQDHPDLLMAKAWVVHRAARYAELFTILDQLEPCVASIRDKSTDGYILWGEFKALKSFQYYATAQGELAVKAAREALAELPDRYYNIRGTALMMLAAALQMQGDTDQGRRMVLEALQQEEGSISVFRSMLLVTLCYLNWISGDLDNLRRTADLVLKHGNKHNFPESTVLGHFFIGIRHFQRNELDLAERSLVSIVGSPGSGKRVIPSLVTHCQSVFALSLTYQAMGRDQDAGEIIESLGDNMLETGNIELLELCQMFRTDLALRQGHVTEADAWIRTHPSIPLAPAYRFYTPQLITPKVLLTRRTAKSLSEAESLLCQMQDYYTSIYSTRVLIDILILQAMVHAAQGNESPARDKLTEALALAKPGGFIRPFLDEGQEIADLLGRLVKKNPTLRYAGEILEAFGSGKTDFFGRQADDRNKPGASLPDKALIAPLSTREIEVLRTLAKGLSNNKIADSLFISTETVKKHLYTIYRKLDVKNRHQAVISAKSLGIL